jgi:hypothetical protein
VIQDDLGVFLIHPCIPSFEEEKAQEDSNRPRRSERLLLLLAREGILDGLGGVAERLLGAGEDTLALVRGIVTAGAGSVTELLGSGLVTLCEDVSSWKKPCGLRQQHTRLDSAGDAVSNAGETLGGLLGGGLLGVRGDLLGNLVTETLATGSC